MTKVTDFQHTQGGGGKLGQTRLARVGLGSPGLDLARQGWTRLEYSNSKFSNTGTKIGLIKNATFLETIKVSLTVGFSKELYPLRPSTLILHIGSR